MPLTTFTARQTTNGFDIDEIVSGHYEEAKREFDKIPEFGLTVPNLSGVNLVRLGAGKEVQIRRNGVLDFTGVIDFPNGKQGSGVGTVEVKGIHKGYTLLQRLECLNYDYTESGAPVKAINGVTVNPWNFFIFRVPGGPLNADSGLSQAIDGVSIDDAMRMCIGTRFAMQMDFQDNSFLRPSQIYSSTNTIQVYRDGPRTQLRPALQRVRNGANFKSGTAIESIPLWNGSQNASTMGTISVVAVKLIGEARDSTNNITIEVCRNASSGARSYVNVPLTATTNYLGTGLCVWDGSVTLTSSTAVKNALGFRINILGSPAATDTSPIYYAKLTADTTSETGVTEGNIQYYANPTTVSAGGGDWAEIDLQGMPRHKAIEALRTQTVSNPLINSSPHWDAWMGGGLDFNFNQRRGVVRNKTYSFAQENLETISHDFNAVELAYQTIARGAGSGDAQALIIARNPSFALYDADRDPFLSTRLYGDLPRVFSFVDSTEKGFGPGLLRKAQAFHKLHRNPIEKIVVKLIPEGVSFFQSGDSITVENIVTMTQGPIRVSSVKRNFSGAKEEELEVVLGEVEKSLVDHVAGGRGDVKELFIKAIPAGSASGLAGVGVNFDVGPPGGHLGVYSFSLDQASATKKVALRFNILPWQATSKSAAQWDTPTAPSTSALSIANAATATLIPAFTLSAGKFGYRATVSINVNGDGAEFDYAATLNTAGTILSEGRVKNSSSTQNRNYTFTVMLPPSSTGDGVAVKITNRSGLTYTFTVSVTYQTIAALTFGLYQFDGDDGDGTGAPVYGTNLSFAVDPPVNALTGVPDAGDFSSGAHPALFGNSQTLPSSADFDVTGYLRVDASGVIAAGEHKVWFKGRADTNNVNGLSVVSVTPMIEYRT